MILSKKIDSPTTPYQGMTNKTNILPVLLRARDIRPIWAGKWPIKSLFWVIMSLISCEKPTYSANDVVPPFNTSFDYGSNMGYYPPYWEDKDLAILAAKCGVNTLRPGLFHHFVAEWGYENRISTFEFYQQMGLRNLVAILGYPAPSVQDTQSFCSEHPSALFRGLYEPIWENDGRQNTANQSNTFAKYVWEVATRYQGLIKIYEIWNEPDFNQAQGWRPAGMPENWWENAPLPCETPLHAPSFHYIRMLRVAYTVIKKVDPDALVAVGGLGWPSYLDVICRYTDEPIAGQLDDRLFPLRGGAYFDCMSFHSYPHLSDALQNSLADSTTDTSTSEGALAEFWRLKNQFDAVLHRHGYNDTIYPAKHWICTEFNLPRRPVDRYPGTEQTQINFVVKALVTAQIHGIKQMHLYSLADETTHSDTASGFGYMGLYKKMSDTPRQNALAWAYKTTAQLLQNARFHPEETQKMALKSPIQGAAFQYPDGHFIYVLWADTAGEEPEAGTVGYHFPVEFKDGKACVMHWDYSQKKTYKSLINKEIWLCSEPVFIR